MLSTLKFADSAKACPGVCVADRIADYCEAILTTEDLCKAGLRCCVSSDVYGDKIPSNVIIPTKTKGNHNKNKNEGKTTTTPAPVSTTQSNLKTTQYTTLSTKVRRPCKGECMNEFFALFCEEIDAEAECPSEGSCCLTSSVSIILRY